METPTYVALSRQTALLRQMDVVANNLANLVTPGFKQEVEIFTTVPIRSQVSGSPQKLAYVQDFATARDNVRLHYEEAGSGTPLLFVHEFAGDWRAWEPQMRYFARRYRCITFSFRGYHPSDVPPDPSSYTYEHFRDDVIAVLDHFKIEKAHICGLSQGGYAALNIGVYRMACAR